MTNPKVPEPRNPGQRAKQGSAEKTKPEHADPVLYEAVLKERRQIVRTIPAPEVKESDSDSDWAAFKDV